MPVARKTLRGRWVSVSGPSAAFDPEGGGAGAAMRGRRGRRVPHMQSVVSAAFGTSGSVSAGSGGARGQTLSVIDRFRRHPNTLAAESSPRVPCPTKSCPSPLVTFEPASMPAAFTPEVESRTLASVAEAPGGGGSPTNGGAGTHTPIAEAEDEAPAICFSPNASASREAPQSLQQRQRRSGYASLAHESLSKSIDEKPIP